MEQWKHVMAMPTITALGRAFSAPECFRFQKTWGVAPGWNDNRAFGAPGEKTGRHISASGPLSFHPWANAFLSSAPKAPFIFRPVVALSSLQRQRRVPFPAWGNAPGWDQTTSG